MSVSLREVIEYGGYGFDTIEDVQWFLGTQQEYAELVELAEDFMEEVDRAELEAEELQERADEARQAMREDGIAV